MGGMEITQSAHLCWGKCHEISKTHFWSVVGSYWHPNRIDQSGLWKAYLRL